MNQRRTYSLFSGMQLETCYVQGACVGEISGGMSGIT
jgi:hypothetical protein